MPRIPEPACTGVDGGHAESGTRHIRGRALHEFPGVSITFAQAVVGQPCLDIWQKDDEPDWHYRGCVLNFDPPLPGYVTAALVWGRNAAGIPRATFTEALPLRDAERLLAAWHRVRRWGNKG